MFFLETIVTGFEKSQCYRINTAVAGNATNVSKTKGLHNTFMRVWGGTFLKFFPVSVEILKIGHDITRQHIDGVCYSQHLRPSAASDSTWTEDMNCSASPPAAARSKQ